VVPAFLGIYAFVALTAIPFSNRIPKWSNDLASSMRETELENLSTRAHALKRKAEELFGECTVHASLLSDYATDLFGSQLGLVTSYQLYSGQEGLLPDFPQGVYTTAPIFESSTWFLKNATEAPAVLNTSSALDNVFRSIILGGNRGPYTAVFIGLAADGLLQYYPGKDMGEYNSLEYVCAKTNNITTGYDSRCRVWYEAVASADVITTLNSTFFSPPYESPTSGTLITVSRGVQVAGKLYGVVGIDIDMADLQRTITSTTVLQSGYSYMINDAGAVVVHPAVKADEGGTTQNITAVDFAADNAKEADDFTQLLQSNVFNGTTDAAAECRLLTYMKSGKQWHLAHCPIAGTRYTVILTVPTREATAAIDSIKRSNTNRLLIGIGVMIGLSLLCVSIGVWATMRLAKNIVQPVDDFIKTLGERTKLDFEQAICNIRPNFAEFGSMTQ
jgi:Cache domain